MRVSLRDDPHAQQFSNLLLKIGEGSNNLSKCLNDDLCCTVSSVQQLIFAVYGDLSSVAHQHNTWLCKRSILTPRNDQASVINNEILSHIQGESR